MKKLYTFLMLTCISVQLIHAQCSDPYYPRIYPTRVETNIPYGTATAYNNTTTNLQMNIWKPIGDNNTARPIILWIHGGGFFTGAKEDMDQLASYYAERGYVSVTMSYRLGFYGNSFFSAPFTYDSSEVIRAAYRAVQDAHGAMRFIKGRAALDSSDVNLAFIGGASAGSITALHFTYVDKPSEIPADGGNISNVQTLFGSVARPDLGPITGILNQNGLSSEVKAVVNLFGALLDTSLIETNNDVPLFSYHQTGDPTVGCGYKLGLWGQPLNVSQNYPHLFGSCMIDTRMQNLTFSTAHYQSLIYNGNVHGLHDQTLVDTLVARFLSDIICENTTGLNNLHTAAVQMSVFPNPAQDNISIRFTEKVKGNIELLDVNGRILLNEKLNFTTAINLGIKSVTTGLYFIRFKNEQGMQVVKVIKN